MDKTIVTYGLIIYQTYVILHTNTIANTKTHSKSAISNTKKKYIKVVFCANAAGNTV